MGRNGKPKAGTVFPEFYIEGDLGLWTGTRMSETANEPRRWKKLATVEKKLEEVREWYDESARIVDISVRWTGRSYVNHAVAPDAKRQRRDFLLRDLLHDECERLHALDCNECRVYAATGGRCIKGGKCAGFKNGRAMLAIIEGEED